CHRRQASILIQPDGSQKCRMPPKGESLVDEDQLSIRMIRPKGERGPWLRGTSSQARPGGHRTCPKPRSPESLADEGQQAPLRIARGRRGRNRQKGLSPCPRVVRSPSR